MTERFSASFLKRFWAKVEDRPEDPNACWLWAAGTTPSGYGLINKGRRGDGNHLAHRVSYEIHKGVIPDGLSVLHSCDRPLCINPEHLRAGTQKENIAEMMERGRGSFPGSKGEKNGRAKLTEPDVLAIRARYTNGESQPALASEYRIGQVAISRIVLRRTWGHI